MVGFSSETASSENSFFWLLLWHQLIHFTKGKEWKYRKQILLCLHLYLLLQLSDLRSTDSTLFTRAKLRLHFFSPHKQEAVFIVCKRLETVHYKTGIPRLNITSSTTPLTLCRFCLPCFNESIK